MTLLVTLATISALLGLLLGFWEAWGKKP